jgi:Ala-tRNA(Pro) deacylase
VHLFIDSALQSADHISFHPNENDATLVISFSSFLRFLESSGNTWEFMAL